MEKTDIYLDYPRSRMMTKEEYQKECKAAMRIEMILSIKGKFKPKAEKAAQLAALAKKGKEEVRKLLEGGEDDGAAREV